MSDDLVFSNDDLLRVLATDGPLDTETIRSGWMLLWWRERDAEATSRLLTRYLTQPLSDSETAWAYMKLANAYAVGERPVEAVSTHEVFERWLPGKSPRLSSKLPHNYPSPERSPDTLGPDEIPVTFVGMSVQFATAYGAVGRYDDYVSKCDAALARLTATKDNVEVRFFGVLIYLDAAQLAGDFARAERYVLVMHAVADEARDPDKVAGLHAMTLTSEIQLARARNDAPRIGEKLQQALSLHERLDGNGSSGSDWVRGYRHNLAHHLTQCDRHDLALPLLDAILATGDYDSYGWLMHAAAVWQVTHDRSRTLALLRDARAHDSRDLAGEFRVTAGFGDVKDDPEFLQAISRTADHAGAGPTGL